jgi:hypothetical protein
LHGLAAIGSYGLGAFAWEQASEAAGSLPRDVLAAEPAWLKLLPDIKATGDVGVMRDAYGTQFGVIADFCYPGGVDAGPAPGMGSLERRAGWSTRSADRPRRFSRVGRPGSASLSASPAVVRAACWQSGPVRAWQSGVLAGGRRPAGGRGSRIGSW